MKFRSDHARVPKLRFPEFSGEWEVKKLGDLFDYKNGGAFEQNIVEEGKYELITLNSLDIEGNIKSQHKRVDRAEWYLRNNDMVMVLSDVARGNFLGLVDIINFDDRYVLNQRMGLLRQKDSSCNLTFVRKYINMHQNYFKLHGQGSSQQNLSRGDILKFKIIAPRLDEQEKIAGFLMVVDERIAAADKKVELLQQYKKGIMQKIFTQKLRFRDENGNDYPAWQTKKLGDIAEKVNSPISAKEIEGRSGEYKVFGASGFLQTLDSYDQAEEYTAIVKDGAGVGRLLWCEAESSVLGTLNIIKPKAINNGKFLHYLLQTFDFTKYSTGSTIPHVYFRDYAKQSVVVPDYKEQQKIASFLTSIDDKINLEKTKLEQAKLFKKSLLQRIFV